MSNDVNYTIYNILQGHNTSLVEWHDKKHSHTNIHHRKPLTTYEDRLLFMSSRMSIDEYQYWKGST